MTTGGECLWWGRGRRPPGWVDSSVWWNSVETWGGGPFPPQGHRSTAVSDRGAVRTANPRSEGSSRHVWTQPAQPVEGYGGHLHEAQWEPGCQPTLQPPTHRILIFSFLSFLTCILFYQGWTRSKTNCHMSHSFTGLLFLILGNISQHFLGYINKHDCLHLICVYINL